MMPMPRPSCCWYTIAPWPSCSISFMAASSCRPQSHLTEPNTSPVMHCEWMRTRLDLSVRNSPLTSATNSSVEISDRKPMMRNSPISVGSCASATNSIVLGPTNLSAIFFSLVLERLQILNQIQFLLLAQVRAKETVVVLDHVAEC